MGFVVYKLSLFKLYFCYVLNVGFCYIKCHGNIVLFHCVLVLFDVIITLSRELSPNWAWVPKMWRCCVMGGVKKQETGKVLPTKKAPPSFNYIFLSFFPFLSYVALVRKHLSQTTWQSQWCYYFHCIVGAHIPIRLQWK
jgi:hypothetical protein